MRCAIYLRVSSEGQAEEDRYGLVRQRTSCEAYAKQMGWEVVGVYTEVMSGAKIWERPTLTQLRKEFPRKTFDVLLVDALDRLSRNTYHQGMIFSEAERYGIKWDSATENITDSPEGKMIQTILGIMAEMEREKINSRMYGGRLARMRSNKLPGMSHPNYGYDWGDEKKTFFVINEEQAAVIRLMYQLADEGVSEFSIAQQLNALGFSTSKGGKWLSSTVHKYLSNPVYIGEMYGHKYMNVRQDNGKMKRVVRPREEWIPIDGAVPPIVDPVVWQRVQEARKKRKQDSPRNNKDPYAHLLRGRIKCAKCLRGLVAVNEYKRLPKRYFHQVEAAMHSECTHISISRNVIDEAVWEQITDVLLNPDVLRKRLEERGEVRKPQSELIRTIEQQVEKLRKQRDTSLQRYLTIEDESLAATANTLIQDLTKQITAAENDLRDLRAEERSAMVEERSVDELIKNLHVFKRKLDVITPELRQRVMDALDVQVFVHPATHEPRWEGSFKLSAERIDLTSMNREERNFTILLGG